MTRTTLKSLQIAAALSLLVTAQAVAEPGADSIMLEKIGAVRMATPDEVSQQRAGEASRSTPRDEHGQHRG